MVGGGEGEENLFFVFCVSVFFAKCKACNGGGEGGRQAGKGKEGKEREGVFFLVFFACTRSAVSEEKGEGEGERGEGKVGKVLIPRGVGRRGDKT